MDRVRQILAEVRPLAAEYYRLTGRPLGVTGEFAEHAAAEILNLELAEVRMPGYDAIRRTPTGAEEYIQIKGRVYPAGADAGQRISRIRPCAACHAVVLVILDNETLKAREMWEAPSTAVMARLAVSGSQAHALGVLSVAEFKRIGRQVWRAPR